MGIAAAALAEDKFKFEQIMKEGRKIVLLQGAIDEDTDFKALTAVVSDSITFNFKNISAINSLGIRGWVNFIKGLADKRLYYEECTPGIVRQMNMVPSFKGHAEVLSVYAPYICDKCDTETLVLIESNEFDSLKETIRCEACQKGEMELDGHPQQYFAFMK